MTGLGVSPMTEGPGVRAERARKRRIHAIFAVSGVVGAALGIGAGVAKQGAWLLTPPAAIAIAVGFVLLLNLSSWFYLRMIDELDRRDNLVACTVGLHFYFTAYPVWWLLWTGGIAPEPMHGVILGTTALATGLAYLWTKLR